MYLSTPKATLLKNLKSGGPTHEIQHENVPFRLRIDGLHLRRQPLLIRRQKACSIEQAFLYGAAG